MFARTQYARGEQDAEPECVEAVALSSTEGGHERLICRSAVTQVGRAGRDGREARCIAFLDDADFRTLRSLVHGDGVDAAAVAGFLTAAFADPPPPRAQKTKAARGKQKVLSPALACTRPCSKIHL